MSGPIVHLLGIDWGSTNRRAYLLDASGHCLRQHEDGAGVLVERSGYAESLAALRMRMQVDDDTLVVMSGMIGSASGWVEVPYLDTSVPLAALPGHGVAVPGGVVVPGYCYRGESIDVMRGEEMQLLGAHLLGKTDGWVVLPGTHSKWVLLRDGRIERFATYMTGELFALLSREGALSAVMAGAVTPVGFEMGLAQARQDAPLSHALFTVRARVVSGALDPELARGVVSGLLVGAEFMGAKRIDGRLGLLGSAALVEHYRHAAAFFDVVVIEIDPDAAYCAALACFGKA